MQDALALQEEALKAIYQSQLLGEQGSYVDGIDACHSLPNVSLDGSLLGSEVSQNTCVDGALFCLAIHPRWRNPHIYI